MISIKTPEEIEFLKVSGKHLAHTLDVVSAAVRPGITTEELDELAEKTIRELGDTPVFLNYQPARAPMPYPATLCTSVDDMIVHGIPNLEPVTLSEGQMITIDSGVIHHGMITDSARTVAVGKVDDIAKNMMSVTKEALQAGIDVCWPGNSVGDIGYAIQEVIKPHGYAIFEVLCGHGVGYNVHEEPNVPNFGRPGSGPKLKPGMVIAIEPMIGEGGKQVSFGSDGYTARTKDGKRSVHYEHTVVITDDGPLVVTR